MTTNKLNSEEKVKEWYLDWITLTEDLNITLFDLDDKKLFDHPTSQNIEITLGRYTVKYINANYYPYILYRSRNSHASKPNRFVTENMSKISFYEDGILIKELPQTFMNPCLILGGDGQTRKGTKFTLLAKKEVNSYNFDSNYFVEIYNFEFELIRQTLRGLPLESLFDTDEDYFLTIADVSVNDPYESPHLGIVKKSDFFNDDGSHPITEPYDNHRVGLPTNGYSGMLFPVKVSKKKMTLSNDLELNYSDVMNFDFHPDDQQNDNMNSILTSLGYPEFSNILKTTSIDIEKALIKDGQVNIKISK